MAKFREQEKFRRSKSLDYGFVVNNNADGTYEVFIDYNYTPMYESEMRKVIDWSNIRQRIENKIIYVFEDLSVENLVYKIVIGMLVLLVSYLIYI